MKKLKLGQIGIGHNHGAPKMEAAKHLPDLFEVVGYCETSKEWLEKRTDFPAYRDIPRMDEAELLRSCDAILVETDVWNLTETAQRCVDAGRHVHIDKPAGGKYSEFEKLVFAAKEKNLALQLGYMYRYNPAIMRLTSMIKEGKLGEIYEIDAEMSLYHTPEYRKWLGNFPCGTMYIFGSHLIDIIVGLLGEPDGVHPFCKQTGFAGVNSFDNCFCLLEYEKAMARVTSLSVECDGGTMRRFAVMGSLATVEIKPLEGDKSVMMFHDNKSAYPIDVPPVKNPASYERYLDMLKDFYSRATEGENPENYERELLTQKVICKVCGIE